VIGDQDRSIFRQETACVSEQSNDEFGMDVSSLSYPSKRPVDINLCGPHSEIRRAMRTEQNRWTKTGLEPAHGNSADQLVFLFGNGTSWQSAWSGKPFLSSSIGCSTAGEIYHWCPMIPERRRQFDHTQVRGARIRIGEVGRYHAGETPGRWTRKGGARFRSLGWAQDKRRDLVRGLTATCAEVSPEAFRRRANFLGTWVLWDGLMSKRLSSVLEP
jgi:hypothetical protein